MEAEVRSIASSRSARNASTLFLFFPDFLFLPLVMPPAALPAKAGEGASFSGMHENVSILFSDFCEIFLNRGSGMSARQRATADHGDEACSVSPEDELRASFLW